MLAHRRTAVVAGRAGPNYMGVIDCPGRIPGCCAVTVLASIRRSDVAWVLTGKIDAIVARETVARDTRMVEYGRHPKGTVMAVVTVVAGRDVTRWFACRGRAVVAGSTTAGHGHVFHVVDGTPRRRRVAAVAGLCRRDVARRFH